MNNLKLFFLLLFVGLSGCAMSGTSSYSERAGFVNSGT